MTKQKWYSQKTTGSSQKKKTKLKNIKIFLNKNKEANRKELPYCLEIMPKGKNVCPYKTLKIIIFNLLYTKD